MSQQLLRDLLGPDAGGSAPPAGAREKAIAWARVSTDMQEDRGLSIPEQMREMRDYAQTHGIEIVEEFHETASAYRNEEHRLEFHRMLERAKADPNVTVVLVHDSSRLSRDAIRSMQITGELHERGVRIVSLNDPAYDPETVAGVYLRHITAAKNEAYSREVSMHTKKGCRANIRNRDGETGWCFKNGGQPLWGYTTKRVRRGIDRRGDETWGSTWALDETTADGRPTHEWTRYCLVELAAKGASLDGLRDFCNEHGIPGRRGRYWTTSTWNALLQPHTLLKYCGHEVWNVHRKNGSVRPTSEWEVVENAHPAIITLDEAKAIIEARRRRNVRAFARTSGRSRSSAYLLSGGVFRCARCGSNMIGHKTSHGTYYVCGSQPYRRGMGCGPGVYVPRDWVERSAVAGAQRLIADCADPQGFARMVNDELRRIWESKTGHDPDAQRKITAIDVKLENIHGAIENGLAETSWANQRLAELKAERERLLTASEVSGEPPQIDVAAAMACRKKLPELLEHATPAEKKQLIRALVEHIRLTPERLEVEITYRVPESVVNKLVAGAGFEPATFGL